MRILLVEDNGKLAGYIRQALVEEGFSVDMAHDGEAGERMAFGSVYDLIILDLMLPKRDGIAVCQNLRDANNTTPIIMITARGEVDDRILGLDSGADDYLVKPFDMRELLARSRALLRRPVGKMIDIVTIQDIVLNPTNHTILHDGTEIALTLKEFAVLEYLMKNVDTVVTREQLLEHCWDFAYTAFSNITDAYIKQLRKKLHDNNEKYIQTIRGVGYKFRSN